MEASLEEVKVRCQKDFPFQNSLDSDTFARLLEILEPPSMISKSKLLIFSALSEIIVLMMGRLKLFWYYMIDYEDYVINEGGKR